MLRKNSELAIAKLAVKIGDVRTLVSAEMKKATRMLIRSNLEKLINFILKLIDPMLIGILTNYRKLREALPTNSCSWITRLAISRNLSVLRFISSSFSLAFRSKKDDHKPLN